MPPGSGLGAARSRGEGGDLGVKSKEDRDSLNPKYVQPRKSIWDNEFAQLNPGPAGVITQTGSLRQPNIKPTQMELEALLASAGGSLLHQQPLCVAKVS